GRAGSVSSPVTPISTGRGCSGSYDAADQAMPRDLVRGRVPNGVTLITSAHNPKLRLIHRLLESRRQREKEGLFVVEGEDLVQAADDAGVDPVEVLRSGEDVEPALLAKVSTMGHPPRVMGLFRHESLPRGVEPLSLSLWRVADPGNLG